MRAEKKHQRGAPCVYAWLCLVDEGYGVGGDAFFAACEAEALGGGGFDVDGCWRDVHEWGERLLDMVDVWAYLGALGADGGVDVGDGVAVVGEEADDVAEEELAVDAGIGGVGVGEVAADVAEGCCSEEGVADGVDEDVGVAMSEEAEFVGDEDAAEP